MIRKFILLTALFSSITIITVTAQNNRKKIQLKDTITDRSIHVPDDLEYNLDHQLSLWKKNIDQWKDCGQVANNALFDTDSAYIHRLYSLPTEMELAYNQIVRSYIDMYTSRRSSSVAYMLSKGKYFFPIFEQTLDKYGLPLELKYLPVIESALNPVAVSRRGATGLWQFMLPTGKMYDLEVNSLVDERRDPLKSTEAAARYLKDLYDIYKDWNLVIAAYNCGPGNINKAIRRSGGQNDYWAIYPYLPKETRGYVPAFIAATYIMNYYSDHGICPAEYVYPASVDTFHIDKTLHLEQVSGILNIPIEDLRVLNPQYKKDIIPGTFKSYPLCLPSLKISQFIAHQDNIYTHRANDLLTHRKTVEIEGELAKGKGGSSGKGAVTHRIKRGETLGGIAKKYGVTVAQIKRLNGLKSNNITAGKNLVIRNAPKTTTKESDPAKPQQLASAETKNKKEENTKTNSDATQTNNFFSDYYKQKNEENTKVAETDNSPKKRSIDNTSLEHSTTKDDPRHPNDTRVVYHKIKNGETLEQIAEKYQVSTKDIISWNNKLAPGQTNEGERIMIYLPEKNT